MNSVCTSYAIFYIGKKRVVSLKMFYIQLPSNTVPFHIVEDCALTRLQYLQLLYENKADNFNGNFEYLFENSVYDNIGHFTLRLIASTSPELWSYWLTRERKLLMHRLNHLSPREIHRLFRRILRRSKTYDHNSNTYILDALETISTHFLKPEVFRHIIEKDHSNDCNHYNCQITFQSVPNLIRRRLINLSKGYAIVPCSKWKVVLESLFNTLIQHEYKVSHLDMTGIVEMDIRLHLMKQKVRSHIFKKSHRQGTITCENISEGSKKFPLCMRHLHNVLRERHRLSHYARFYYSLFLKECGMTLNDSITYWKNEYSKPHSCTSGCTHDWQTSEKKFIYSIRHLYGLEGARKHYKPPNCQMIYKEIPGPRYEGGCPFKNFERAALLELMDFCVIDADKKEQLINMGREQPEMACGMFFKLVNKTDKNIVIHSPVQYYGRINETKD